MTELTPAAPHTPARLAERTFLQGLGIDLGVAAGFVLATAFGDIRWTAAYWIGLGLSLTRTVLQTGVAYTVRKLVALRQR
jgi:hypothetical protein